MAYSLTELVVRIILIDSASTSAERQHSMQIILTLSFPTPIDFVFDYINNRLALALDFEGHPELVEYLKTLDCQKALQVVGGRFGRAESGELATSEWSGHYGEAWNNSLRDCFKEFMRDCGIHIRHREWYAHQTSDRVG
jgi:hypothetical protein